MNQGQDSVMYNTFRVAPYANSSSSHDTQGKEREHKRSKVTTACTSCRKNKTKCNGDQPCGQCISQSLACSYDGADGRRGHKRTLQDTQQERDHLQSLFEHLRDSDPLSASMIYARIRQGETIQELVQYTNASEVARARDELSIETAVVSMLSGTQIGFEGAIEYIVPTISNDSWETTWKYEDTANTRDRIWTQVPLDQVVVRHLVDVYFCWLHHHIPMFSKAHFLQALVSGDPRYCSPILVNAILSAACFYCQTSDLSIPALDDIDYRSLSTRFMSEAETWLKEELDRGVSTMTSVQALVIMGFSYVQLDENARSKMWQCFGQATVMMQTLNLDNHLGDKVLPRTDAASITFWGLLMADRLGTHICGKRGHVRTTGRPRRPLHYQSNGDDTWIAFDHGSLILPRRELFSEIASAQHDLFQIIDDMQSFSYLFGAPLKVVDINSIYRRLYEWRQSLPDALNALSGAAPNLFHLMALYHAVVLRLFRPFIQNTNHTFTIDPRVACNEAAFAIVELETAYEDNFGLYFSSIYHLHHIFAAACTYIGDLSAPDSLAIFVRCLALMQVMEIRFRGPVQRAFRCIFHLLKRWHQLTLEVWEACMAVVAIPAYQGSLQSMLGRYSPSLTAVQVLTTEEQDLIDHETQAALETGDFDFLFSDWLRTDVFLSDQLDDATPTR